MLNLQELFDKHEDEYSQFGRIESPRHPRPDVCAFIMLHDLAPREPSQLGYVRDMVACAEHDEIWLDTDVSLLAANATEDDIVALIRCGVRYDADTESLAMFV